MANFLLPLILLVSAMLLLEIFSSYQHSGKSFGKGCNPPNRLISIVGASPTKHEKSLLSRAKKTIRVKCLDLTQLGITPTPSLTGGQVPKLQSGKKSLIHTSKPKGQSYKQIITSTTIEKQFILRLNDTVRYITQKHQSIKFRQPHEAVKTPTGSNSNQNSRTKIQPTTDTSTCDTENNNVSTIKTTAIHTVKKANEQDRATYLNKPTQTQSHHITNTATLKYTKYLQEYNTYRNKVASIIRNAFQEIRDELHIREHTRQQMLLNNTQSTTIITNNSHTTATYCTQLRPQGRTNSSVHNAGRGDNLPNTTTDYLTRNNQNSTNSTQTGDVHRSDPGHTTVAPNHLFSTQINTCSTRITGHPHTDNQSELSQKKVGLTPEIHSTKHTESSQNSRNTTQDEVHDIDFGMHTQPGNRKHVFRIHVE